MEVSKTEDLSVSGNHGNLSTKDHWKDRWQEQNFSVSTVRFDPTLPLFADLHELFCRVLPTSEKMTFLEVGCYPGYYLWYFNHYLGYQVSGLEYVESCCAEASACLEHEGVSADIIHADFFEYSADENKRQFDVVASFGFIEHFTDYRSVISKHLDLVIPGGYLVLTIPNHQGFYGEILKCVDKEKFATHNRMNLSDIRAVLDEIGSTELVEEGYYGRIGFWNSGLYTWAGKLGKLFYPVVRAPFWGIEKLGRMLPNSSVFSPVIVSVVRKSDN